MKTKNYKKHYTESERKERLDKFENLRKNNILKTGAHREDKNGKGKFNLLPPRAIKEIANRLEIGSKKYGDKDWSKGIPFSMLLDSALRHQFQYLAGKNDENHLSAAITNLLQMLEQEELIKEGKLKKELNDL